MATISFWPISWPSAGSWGDGAGDRAGDGAGDGDGDGVDARRAGVGVGVGSGARDASGVADRNEAKVVVGRGESVQRGDDGAAGTVADGVGRTVTGIEPRESALTPLSSAEPAITKAAMTTRAQFIAHQTPGHGPDVHAIVRRIADVNVSVDPVRLLDGSVEVPRGSGAEMQWRRSR